MSAKHYEPQLLTPTIEAAEAYVEYLEVNGTDGATWERLEDNLVDTMTSNGIKRMEVRGWQIARLWLDRGINEDAIYVRRMVQAPTDEHIERWAAEGERHH